MYMKRNTPHIHIYNVKFQGFILIKTINIFSSNIYWNIYCHGNFPIKKNVQSCESLLGEIELYTFLFGFKVGFSMKF
jgi:hypothetical protein